MKKILFVLSVISMLVVVGCSNPTNMPIPEETPQKEKPVEKAPETPTQPEQPPVTEQPPTPESQPEDEGSDEEETQEETEQGDESEEETEQEEESEEEETPQVPEDKSPFEYVKPACVNLADYTYVGDYIFADTMNFAEWKYSNAETDYRLAFEKVARVKNDNPETRIIRYNHNDPDTPISVIKATKYKIYAKTTFIDEAPTQNFINLSMVNFEDTYDGTRIRIKLTGENSFRIFEKNDPVNTLINYVAY